MNTEVYQKTEIIEDIELPAIIITIEENKVDFLLVFIKSLNSLFWGNIKIEIFNKDGITAEILPIEKNICYNCCTKSYIYDKSQLTEGLHRVAFTFSKEMYKSKKVVGKKMEYRTLTFEFYI